MKHVTLSVLAMMAISSMGFAGGGTAPVVEPVVTIPAGEEAAKPNGFYAGIGLSVVIAYEDKGSFFDHEAGQERTGDVTLLGGYEFNPYIAVEARYMNSFTHDDMLDRNLWGVYVKPQYPITEELNVYGLLGYGSFELDGKNGSGIDIDEDGFQWGAGISYDITDNIVLFVDYLNIANDLDVDLFFNPSVDIDSEAVTVGAIYKF